MPRVAKKVTKLKLVKDTKKQPIKPTPVTPKKPKPNGKPKAKVTNPRGAYTFEWGNKGRLDWFRDTARRFGMSRCNLVRFAVEEYALNHKPKLDK